MAIFKPKDGALFIDGKQVLRGWESFSGWYWFGVEEVEKGEGDTMWYGYVQGHCEEWGYFSQAEIESLAPKTWEIPQQNLRWSGRRTEVSTINMIPVTSSSVGAIGYDAGTLQVEFKNGGDYIYFGVPQVKFEKLKEAQSVGRAYHDLIRGKYECQKLEMV